MGRAATAVLTLFISSLVACATTVSFLDAPAQPAASGSAKISVDDNGNTGVRLTFEHLAPPEKLNPPRTHYALWAESSFGRTLLLGRLRVDRSLEAAWDGPVPFDRFRIIVSGEIVETPEQPAAPFVLVTEYLEPKQGLF